MLIVAPRKFDFLKTNICPRSKASKANMRLVQRHKHSIVFIVHHLIFFLARASSKIMLNDFQLS